MIRNLLTIICIFISTISLANYEILEVNEGKKLVAVKYNEKNNKLIVGHEFVIKDDKGNCTLKITKIKDEKNLYYTTYNNCKETKLTKGLKLKESEFNEFSKVTKEDIGDYPSKNESWYTYWGIGLALPQYEGTVKETMNIFKNDSDFSRLPMALDIFGFYWPIRINMMLGFIVNTAADSYTDPDSNREFTFSQYTYSLSAMKFFGKNIGDGFFIRTEAGIAKYNVTAKSVGTDVNISSKSGFGFLIGGGYAIPSTLETRLLLNINYAMRNADSVKVNTLGFSVGALF